MPDMKPTNTMPGMLEVIGYAAGGLTSLGMYVQVLQILYTHESRDVSPVFFTLMMLGIILWLYYGLKRRDLVLIFWNIIGVLLCATVLALKIYYG